MKQRRQLELELEAAKKKRLVVTIDLMGRKVIWRAFLDIRCRRRRDAC